MRAARVLVHGMPAGVLEELPDGKFRFTYTENYQGPPVSLTMPHSQRIYEYAIFPPFFDGLLPEGILLEALLRTHKLDKHDYLSQLLCVGNDLVGAVTVEAMS